MAGGLTVSVRQITSYPTVAVSPNDRLLLQQGGLGGPYISNTVYDAINNAMASGGPLGVGFEPPANAWGGGIFADQLVTPITNGGVLYNCYFDVSSGSPVLRYWMNGVGGGAQVDSFGTYAWQTAPAGLAGAPVIGLTNTMLLSNAGNLSLPLGTLTVARDPSGAMDVTTRGWVGANTVASFNGRKGVVTLDACDIGMALGYPTECIATLPQVSEIVCQAIQDLIHTYPAVWSFNGRVGDVWLTVADINWALAQGGLPPIGPNPPADSNDGSLATTEWVRETIAAVLLGPPAYATEDWVTAQLAALNTGVTSFNGRQGVVSLTYLDVASLGFAPTNSPGFSGVPSAPTAAPGTSSGQLATTAFVMAAVTAATTGVISFDGRTGAVVFEATDISSVGGALLASPNFTGTPTSTTPTTGDSSTRIATTAFVMAAVAAATAGVATWNGRTGNVTLSLADVTAAGGAPIASPGFSGVPTAPTAPNGTNTLQLATTAFVQNELTAISAGVISFNGRSGAVVFTANDLSAVDGAQLASPAFTGVPTAPTAAPNNNSTQIATTAYVANAIQGAAVTSFNGRSGTVTLSITDITGAGGAPAASPALTGLPTAPTAAAGNSSTLLATTAFVTGALAGYLPLGGGVMSGPITLAGNAAQPLQAVPLQQLTASLGGYLPLSGGILTGPLTLPSGSAATPALVIGNGGSFYANAANQITLTGSLIGMATVSCANLGASASINTNGTIGAVGNITTQSNLIVSGYAQIGSVLVVPAGGFTISSTNTGTGTVGLLQLQGPINAEGLITCPGLTINGSINLLQNNAFNNGIPGAAWFQVCSYNFPQQSDITSKNNIVAYAQGVSQAAQLLPKTFFFNGDATNRQHLGFVAQDIQSVIPDAIITSEGTPLLSLDVTAIVAVLANAVKQLISRVATLESNANITPSAANVA